MNDNDLERLGDGCGQGCFEIFALFIVGMIFFLGICALFKTNPFAG